MGKMTEKLTDTYVYGSVMNIAVERKPRPETHR